MRANLVTALVAAGMVFAGPAIALDCSRPETSSDVAACLEQDFGDRPFAYSPPDGYRPFSD